VKLRDFSGRAAAGVRVTVLCAGSLTGPFEAEHPGVTAVIEPGRDAVAGLKPLVLVKA